MSKKTENQNTEDQNVMENDDDLVIDLTKMREESAKLGGGDLDLDKVYASVQKTEDKETNDTDPVEENDASHQEKTQSTKEDQQDPEEEPNEDANEEDDPVDENEEGDDKKKPLSKSQKRIIELNEKKKQAEKEAKEANEKASRLEAELKTSQFNSSKRNYETTKSALDSQVKLAEQEYIRAQNEGDTAGASKAISQMTMAQTQLVAIEAALESIKGSETQHRAEEKQQQTIQTNDSGVDVVEAQRLAAKFLRKHPKVYGDDKYANMIKQMTNQVLAEGELTQDSAEYWEEVDNLIAEVEEANTKKTPSSKQATKTPVSGAGQGSQTAKSKVDNNPNLVKLTAREAQTARNLGLSYEQYAQEKANETDFVILPKPRNSR